MLNLKDYRTINAVGAIACAGLMVYALYAQHFLDLEPCPLCVFQRVAVIVLGIVFLLVALHNPKGVMRKIYACLILLVAGAGAGVAGRHVWLQSLPPDQVPACGPGFDYIMSAFALPKALDLIFSGSGECALVDWSFLGLSMPMWVMIALLTLGSIGFINNLRSTSA